MCNRMTGWWSRLGHLQRQQCKDTNREQAKIERKSREEGPQGSETLGNQHKTVLNAWHKLQRLTGNQWGNRHKYSEGGANGGQVKPIRATSKGGTSTMTGSVEQKSQREDKQFGSIQQQQGELQEVQEVWVSSCMMQSLSVRSDKGAKTLKTWCRKTEEHYFLTFLWDAMDVF